MTDDQTDPGAEGAPGPADIERAVQAAAPDYGDLFARAVFASFFHAPVIGIGGGNGAPVFPMHGKSPVQEVCDAVWQRCSAEVTREVTRAFDVDTLIERVTDRLYERLTTETERNDRFTGRLDRLTPSLPDVQRMVREKLADRLTDRQMAAWDAEQEQMRAAWQRERARAETPAIKNGGGTDG